MKHDNNNKELFAGSRLVEDIKQHSLDIGCTLGSLMPLSDVTGEASS